MKRTKVNNDQTDSISSKSSFFFGGGVDNKITVIRPIFYYVIEAQVTMRHKNEYRVIQNC